MAKLNFTAQTGRTRALKRSPSKYALSAGRPNISQSDGIRPAFPLQPFSELAAKFQDTNTQDWVVIPKGRAVSAITPNDGAHFATDDDFYGVGRGVLALMVPSSGGYVWEAAVGGFTQSADHAPIGVVEHDVYQDIRGDNLNYDMRNKNWGVMARQLIKLPAVDLDEWDTQTLGEFVVAESPLPPVAAEAGAGYVACEKKFSFLSYNGGSEGQSGMAISADYYGNMQSMKAAQLAQGNQKIGYLMGIDYRFPKDLLDTVQNPYEPEGAYRVAGTGTKGVPQFLYDFAYEALNGASYDFGANDPATKIKALCDAGVFGEAWIQINVS
jgi:hypothetical protein